MTSYVPVTVGEQEVWVEVKLTTKQFTDTKVSPAFDPFVAREEYEEDMRIKEEIRKAKEIEKADRAKVKASKSRSSRKIVENSEKEEVQE